jgi:hypothetical protein
VGLDSPLGFCRYGRQRCLILRFVLTRFAAGFTVVEAVFAQTDLILSHADVTITIALAALFNHLALGTTELDLEDGHERTVSPWRNGGKVSLVTRKVRGLAVSSRGYKLIKLGLAKTADSSRDTATLRNDKFEYSYRTTTGKSSR